MRESLQSKDKQDGSSEVTELDVDIHFEFPFFPAGFTGGSRLNIFNMRSVIMNPPITLIEAEITAMKPSHVATGLSLACPRPATTIAPTTEIAESALVAAYGAKWRRDQGWVDWWSVGA